MTDKKASLYIHIPYCISKCRYCDFFSRTCECSDGRTLIPDEYLTALVNEIKFRFNNYACDCIDTLYVGGGTPSLLSGSQINYLFNSIKLVKAFSKNAEITFEVNPDDVKEELLENLAASGVNRLSCGIQTMNQKALEYAGRRASADINRKALSLFRKNWQGKLSLDLICGLPYETKESFLQSLQAVIDAHPDHISMYSLTIEEETPFGKALEDGSLEYDFEKADNLWIVARDYLEEKGYPQYEVSNFAINENRCRHNLIYWNHKDYIGAGSGATGSLYNVDGSGKRWTNTKNLNEYMDFWNNLSSFSDTLIKNNKIPQIEENITLETSEFEFFMMTLRKTDGFAEEDFMNAFNKKLPQKFNEVFSQWQKKGLAERDSRYYLNKKGLLFLNAFLEELI